MFVAWCLAGSLAGAGLWCLYLSTPIPWIGFGVAYLWSHRAP